MGHDRLRYVGKRATDRLKGLRSDFRFELQPPSAMLLSCRPRARCFALRLYLWPTLGDTRTQIHTRRRLAALAGTATRRPASEQCVYRVPNDPQTLCVRSNGVESQSSAAMLPPRVLTSAAPPTLNRCLYVQVSREQCENGYITGRLVSSRLMSSQVMSYLMILQSTATLLY